MANKIQYTDINHQIDKLLHQHLNIQDLDFAKSKLELYGYSNLIKSYRAPYVVKSNEMLEYRSGVSFNQIYSLYMLDKNLRNSVMASMQDLEEHIKESAASVIASAFGVNLENYLKFKNYANKYKSKYRFTLPSILDSLKETSDTDKNPVHHYMAKYGTVPPWILFKSIYFSTIINFIDLFKPQEQGKLVEKLYDCDTIGLSINSLRLLMMDTLFICLEYRNFAAHGGRIYNHKSSYDLRADKIFGPDNQLQPKGFSQLLFLLSLFNYDSPFKRLQSALSNELSRHCSFFPQDITYLGQTLNINIVPIEPIYITRKSKIYHHDPHCSGISNVTKLTANEAKEKGYRPCKRCATKGPSLPT